MMNAGELNRRITIQQKSVTSNSFGEDEETWTDLATVWAQRQALTTKDVTRQQGQKVQAEGRYLIRYMAGVTADMRVSYQSDISYIVGIDEYHDGEGLLLYVRQT